MACSVSTRLAGKFARLGELSFLPQWVSATSALRGLDRLTRLSSNFTRQGEWTCTSAYFLLMLLAITNMRRVTSTFYLSSPLSSPWRVVLCISSCFLASKVSRRVFSYKELALDVKSIIEWFFSICELFAG